MRKLAVLSAQKGGKFFAVAVVLNLCILTGFAQNTSFSGNWSDPTVWSGGAVPASNGTINVNLPLTIDTNLGPTGGTWTFGANAIDAGTHTFNATGGTIVINSGVTVSFGGAGTFDGATITVNGTLILSSTQINNNGGNNIKVASGGTLIINGDLTSKDNSGTFQVDGSLIVNGNLDLQTGSITLGGSGTVNTTGTISSTGGSTVFGSQNDCTSGPCSGTNLTCTFTNSVAPKSAAICSGTSTGTLTATSNAAGASYQWQSSTDGTTYSNISGATSTTYTNASLSTTTWYRMQVTDNTPCTSQSGAVKVTVLSSTGGWLGGTSNDWGTAANWCSTIVPTSSTDVTISNATGIANMPTIASGTAALCRNLTINSTFPASTVTIAAASDASLAISGNVTNNGTLTDNSTTAGGVSFVGTTAQTVSGTSAFTFNNLTFNNTSGSSLAVKFTGSNIQVNNSLALTKGAVNLNNFSITLGTSAASTGTLSYTSGRFYGGNVQRWFGTGTISLGSNASLIPIGSSSDYRPIYFANPSTLTAGGTLKVTHTSSAGSTSVAFSDDVPIQVRSNSSWTVTTGTTISGTFDVRTEGTGFGTVGDVNDLRITKINVKDVGSPGTNGGTTTNPQVNRTGGLVAAASSVQTKLYWGSINSTQTPLPLLLASFTATVNKESVSLDWLTSSELNFDYFSLQRSADGVSFNEIAQVKGHGTTSDMHSYSFDDSNPIIGRSYYRLTSNDFDGYQETFKVISVEYNGEKKFAVSPNPNDGSSVKLNFNFENDSDAQVVIYDNLGSAIGTYRISGAGAINFDNQLKSGVYLAKYTSASFTKTERFIVK